jgi:hypothetical protein
MVATVFISCFWSCARSLEKILLWLLVHWSGEVVSRWV